MKRKAPKEKYVQPSRVGRKAVTTYLPPETFERLSILSELTGLSLEKLMSKSVKMIFKYHRLPRTLR
ncbi:ribbon-helix-helix domain-containing protein [Methylorubrum rhodesianum]|uniref:ribbon-helix-helix domain-containing protein n=1 Tax=Methylorubrum rhodesianum TaxID=29427 RepID=UPI003CFF2964